MFAVTKIQQLHKSNPSYADIFKFDVAMDNVVSVQMGNCGNQLCANASKLVQRNRVIVQVIVQGATLQAFHNESFGCRCVNDTIHIDNIRARIVLKHLGHILFVVEQALVVFGIVELFQNVNTVVVLNGLHILFSGTKNLLDNCCILQNG